MDFSDTLTLDSPRRTADGYLSATVKVARTGIQSYTGAEVGKPELASVRVFRPEDEVFHKDSLKTLAYKPVTVDHPPVAVTSKNWREFSAGVTGGEIARDGEFISVPLALMDDAAISTVEKGKRQLSCGYACDIEWTAGKMADGSEYDAIQRNIRFNHLSIVGAARGGSQLRIGDSKPMITIVHDGIGIEFADQAAAAYNSLLGKLTAATADIAKLNTDIAARDASLAKAEAERDAFKGKILDGAALDAAVAKRADLISTAKAIAPAIVTDGKSDDQIVKDTVIAAGIALDGKSADYIRARFDILAEDAKAQGKVHQAISDTTGRAGQYTYQATLDAARKAAVDLNAWRNEKQA